MPARAESHLAVMNADEQKQRQLARELESCWVEACAGVQRWRVHHDARRRDSAVAFFV